MDPSKVNLALIYKNFQSHQGISHIGLGVSMMLIAKVLQQNGIMARVIPATGPADVTRVMQNDPTITHLIVGAPWIPTPTFSYLCDSFYRTVFAMNCHSNVGFLGADSGGVKRIREAIDLESGKANFHLCGNSEPFNETIIDGYGSPCTYLPNLYALDDTSQQSRPVWDGGELRIGIFGATRWGKNITTAIGAALIVARQLKAQTKVFMNSARVDSPEVYRIWDSAKNMVAGIPNLELVQVPWAPWPKFRTWVDSMHVMMQPSFTESYNLVSADGCAKGVPSVVSPAINWVPESWKAPVDDAPHIAQVAIGLVQDPLAPRKGLQALQAHNAKGINYWLDFVLHNKFGTGAAQWYAAGMPKDPRVRPQPYPHAA